MSKGFTFIELAVAVGILLGLVGFGAASYVNFNERQILEQAAKDLKNNLRVAQQNATSGVKDNDRCLRPGDTVPQTFRGWCISPVHSDPISATAGQSYDSYQIYGVCDTDETDGFEARTFPGSIVQLDLPEGVQLTTRAFSPNLPGPDHYVTNTENSRARFNVFGNNMRFEDDTYTKVVYCLEGSFPSLGDDDTYQITINRSGEINDNGFVNDCSTI